MIFPEITFRQVLVIGLGQLGLPVAKYIKERGFDVYGYDISTKALELQRKSKSIKSKIIQAAIQVDAEYRMYRESRALRVPRVG